jgi:hypothetical protein
VRSGDLVRDPLRGAPKAQEAILLSQALRERFEKKD